MSNFKKNNEQKRDQIVNFLDKYINNCSDAKYKLSEGIDDLGFQIELGKTQRNLWKDLEPEALSESIAVSGIAISQEMLNQLSMVLKSVEDISLGNFIDISTTACVSLASVAVSGVSLSYAPNVSHLLIVR
ncbi:hypothetical protein FJZ33_00480 [Candidatus Poribacteria bacterium]|nr:hypothetical protein [Candidatus Poribacteria bacterium]